MDAMYLLIPTLLKNRKKSTVSDKYCSSPLDQLLNNNEMNHVLSKLKSKMDLKQICNIQEIDDEIYCVLNDDKVIKFFELKLKNIQKTLKNNTSISINIDPLHDALSILNEYIPSYFFDKICEKYKVSAKRVINPRKRKKSLENDEEVNNTHKKRKINNLNENDLNKMNIDHMHGHPFNDQRNHKKQIKATPKSRAISNLSKVNTKGMKSMMSYFSKKKK